MQQPVDPKAIPETTGWMGVHEYVYLPDISVESYVS